MSTTYQRPRGAPGGGILKLPRATSVGIAVSSLNDGFTLLELADARNAKRGQETQFPSILLTAQDGSTWRVGALAKGSGNGTLQLAVVPGGTPTELMAAKGVTDGSNAAPGQIGELLSANRTTGLSVANSVNTDLVTLALSAGDWDCCGAAYFTSTATLTNYLLTAWINSISAVAPDGSNGGLASTVGSASLAVDLAIPMMRFNVTAATTVYLSTNVAWGTVGGVTAKAFIRACRVR